MLHVPYKGAALVLPDLMAGRVTFMFDSIITARQNVLAGNMRALGVSGGKRAPPLPNVPTLAESGLPGFEPSGAYMGLWGPAGTPVAVVQRVNADMNRILFAADMKEELAKLGLEPTGGTPEAFGQLVQHDIEAWSEVVRKTGIRAE
jgi:tripartite-type tricarboxylate transporter receptor subunit TctC